MRNKLLIIILIISFNTTKVYCQNDWQTVKKFNLTTNSLEISSNNIMVVGVNTYYISSNETDWTTYNSDNTILSGTIIGSNIKGDNFYLASNQKIYTQNNNALNLVYSHPTGNISQFQFYKKGLMLSETNGGPIFLYKNNKLDTLNYNGIKSISYRQFIAADDSIAIVGYDNNYNAKKLNNSTSTWENFAPSIANWYYCYLQNGIVIGVTSKAGLEVSFSNDYGKEFVTLNNPVGNMYQKTTFGYNENTFYVAGKGLYSSNNGTSWNQEIKDSVFTDIKIRNGILYALTKQGTLLKKTISIVTKVDNFNQVKYPVIYPNPFTNQANLSLPSLDNYTLEINDPSGKQIVIYQNIQGINFIIDNNKLISGLYFYTLTNQLSGERINGKFVTNK